MENQSATNYEAVVDLLADAILKCKQGEETTVVEGELQKAE